MFNPKSLIGWAIVFSLPTMASFAQTIERRHAPLVLKQAAVMPQTNATSRPAIARQVVPPARYEEMAAFITPRLSPIGSTWVRQNAVAFRSGARSEDQIRNDAAQSSGTLLTTFGDGQATDIESLVFLVLMTAQKDANRDLREQLAAVQSNQQVRAKNRQALVAQKNANQISRSQVAGEMATNPSGLNGLVGTSEMGETESLNMQMAMDRMSKMMAALSNILKKMSDTNASITNNIK